MRCPAVESDVSRVSFHGVLFFPFVVEGLFCLTKSLPAVRESAERESFFPQREAVLPSLRHAGILKNEAAKRRKSLCMKENPAVVRVLRPTESGLPD